MRNRLQGPMSGRKVLFLGSGAVSVGLLLPVICLGQTPSSPAVRSSVVVGASPLPAASHGASPVVNAAAVSKIAPSAPPAPKTTASTLSSAPYSLSGIPTTLDTAIPGTDIGKTPATPIAAEQIVAGATPTAPASPLASASPGAAISPVASAAPALAASPIATPTSAPTVGMVTVVPPANGSGQTIINVNTQPASPTPTSNSWLPGLFGIGLLSFAAFLGLRYAKRQGMTVQQGLKQLGVEMPQDGIATVAPARASTMPSTYPPLPSLADLPPAQPSPMRGVAMPASPIPYPKSAAAIPTLAGLSGSISGVDFPLADVTTIGRDPQANTLPLPQESTVSRRHAKIEIQGNTWTLTDVGSVNGTFVNGQRLSGATALHSGDEVQIGSARFRFTA